MTSKSWYEDKHDSETHKAYLQAAVSAKTDGVEHVRKMNFKAIPADPTSVKEIGGMTVPAGIPIELIEANAVDGTFTFPSPTGGQAYSFSVADLRKLASGFGGIAFVEETSKS